MYFRFTKQTFGVATISNKLYLKLVNLGYSESLIVVIGYAHPKATKIRRYTGYYSDSY